ncbi:hypothetical protein PF005_g19802 [Phytophthora fragariae]|uniref:Uncharacterized protein n=1 Tax=Phytophthora fragariae TaxID=53985 RepID=A0A6A3X7F3_9STRA|nr:hypothetical protein PF003_g22168 [Phytophthora fragariae]KAE8929312.1 hypothetical protein PF009_g20568 [Phytophthora fragariae]KAE8986933.1 hypothetical protein PF011_g19785 [Phytophthora fragariae]KAE9083954.1 hypothetical protein PF007_g21694 [Phytophthora fragariae]KAE9085140.1 hypothetical protein PF010_g20567 [Phytophthora fragariae]
MDIYLDQYKVLKGQELTSLCKYFTEYRSSSYET